MKYDINTEILEVNLKNISHAANIIKNGGTVVFPTETVYGLGADALNPDAVKKIFKAKGRPSDNPLIVHVSCEEMISDLIRDKDILRQDKYKKLAAAFWPGPLTIIFQKNEKLCGEVTAGLDTVGIRIPENKIALKLIELAGTGIAAPSANTSGKPSPTKPEHVIEDMNGRVDVILCADASTIGIESTVLDMTCEPPAILRPGGVSYEQLESVLGVGQLEAGGWEKYTTLEVEDVPKSPGMKYRHYAPKGKLTVFFGEPEKVAKRINELYDDTLKNSAKPHILASRQTICYYLNRSLTVLGDSERPETFAAELYSALRHCDELGVQMIYSEAISEKNIGQAVMNRLLKASGNNFEVVK